MKSQLMIILIGLWLCMSIPAFAQMSDYTFAASTGTYTEITGGTLLGTETSDDQRFVDPATPAGSVTVLTGPGFPIGFDFMLNNYVFDRLAVCNNGWISLGQSALTPSVNITSTSSYTPLSSTSVITPAQIATKVSALARDLQAQAGSTLRVETIGDAPNRVCIVQFHNYKRYSTTGTGDVLNFQIQLYETLNKVSFAYGPFTMGTSTTASAVQIGMRGSDVTDYINRATTTDYSATTAGTVNTASCTLNNLCYPAAGLIYSFMPPVPATNDLQAISVSGNATPSVGTVANYVVSIRNRGSSSQSNYTVKLMNGATEMASVNGTMINSMQLLDVPITWTPTAVGQLQLTGMVVLAGDENPANDISNPMNIIVMPAGTSVVSIGDGSQTNYYSPVSMYYKNSLFETIYYANEINSNGNITAISFYNSFITNVGEKPTKIWLGTTTNADLSAGWIPSTALTQVFDGNVNYPVGQNLITIPLQVPYLYAGGNLVLLVQRPMDTVSYTTTDLFKHQTIGTNRARRAYSSTVTYDPAAPPAGTLTGQFPQTLLHFMPTGTNPSFAVTPVSQDFGQVLMNTTRSQQIMVANVGGGTLSVSNISVTGSPYFTLSNLPILPASLSGGQNTTFTINYTPTEAGTHTATITVTDNMTRLAHPIQVTGSSIDQTIYTLPYAQNFNAVTPPALPIDWNFLIQSTVTTGYVRTVTTTPHSAPNAVTIYNSTDIAASVLLISPPLTSTIPINTTRVKFWAKGATTYTLKVGIMSNPTDATTFVESANITLTAAWAEYTVAFQTYTGAGHFVAIKHGCAASSQTIYVDDVMLEVIPQNDLAALSVAGNTTPSVGAVTTYNVTINNTGISAQSNYLVKLFNSNDVELASAAGLTINPGQTLAVPVNWTPTLLETTVIYGKVVMTGDQNNLNDQTPTITVYPQPTGTMAITIGDGSQTNYYSPLSFYYKNSMFETIYYATEIGIGGLITAVSFYNNFLTATLNNMPTKIWLGTTELNDLSAGWINSGSLTQVFDGTVNYPAGQNTITIQLQTPYIYAGGNLVLLANRPMDTQYYSTSDVFYNQTIGTTRARRISSDTVNYDAATVTGGTLTGQFPKTTFFFQPIGDMPHFAVSPQSWDFGQVLMNTSHNQQFTVLNFGIGALTINAISISGSPMFSLQNLPTLPVSLSSGVNATFNVNYLPTAAGQHTATITITDNLTRSYTFTVDPSSSDRELRIDHTVGISATCTDPTIYTLPYVQAFDTVTIPALPIDWSSLVQATVTTAYARTLTTTPHSTPNCVGLYNGTDTAAEVFLIAPPVVATIPITTTRVKFWFKSSSANYSLQVGIMSDVTNPTSFQLISTLAGTTTWTEQVVSFQTYTGTGRNIVFRHGLGGGSRTLYVDDAMIEIIPDNDLAALSLSGNVTPTVGMASNYSLTLFNWGVNPQTNYTVKLFTEGNIEVASVAGPAIQPGTQAVATLAWVPQTEGVTFLYGKVVLTGDQNNLNNQTPNLNVAVQSAGSIMFTIGDGSQTARTPMDMYYKNSLFETVYQSTELNIIGMITGIAFYNNFITDLQAKPTKIWLGTTTQADLSAGWIPSTQLTQVFDGTVNYPSGQNMIIITLQNPYLYLEGNLVMMVNRPMDTQYFNTADNFFCQTVGNNRSLKLSSDTITYDPTAPPAGTLSGQFPKTSFAYIPGFVGHLTGTVYGAGNLPLPNTTVQIQNWAQTTTDANGHYLIQNIVHGDYTVTASRYGYYDSVQNVTIPEDSTITLNFTLTQMPTVTVTGTIVGSDAPTLGLPGSTIRLTGYENYDVTADAAGVFTIPGVYINQTYTYMASGQGYQNRNDEVTVGATNQNMGFIVLNEIAYSPRTVTAAESANSDSVNVSWLAPDPNAVDVTQGFETIIFPPTDWSHIITNNGPPNESGGFPTWCRLGAVPVAADMISPPEGLWQAGVWFSFSHQDEWLITPQFNCPQGATLSFETNVFLGSQTGEHNYVKASADNGDTWTVLWDAAAQTGGWNHYTTPVVLELGQFTGQQIKLAWHADDADNTSDGLWNVWFIDNVVVANNETTIRFPESQMLTSSASESKSMVNTGTKQSLSRGYETLGSEKSISIDNPTALHNRYVDRSLVGYKLWRLPMGQEQNEEVWTPLTTGILTSTNFTDTGWSTMAEGTYKWAVKGIYTNEVLSLAMFSNPVVKGPTLMGSLAGLVRNANNQVIPGAVVTTGSYTTTTASNGSYTLAVPEGTHTVTCTATGYDANTQTNVVVSAGLTTVLNFNMGTVSNEDEIAVTATTLKGNHPNPFNPVTTLSFDVKDRAPVRIDIYNVKGQLIRTLVNETKAKGHYSVVWNGKDQHGNEVGSGVYHYRMQAGNYKATRRMMLMK